ncbi:energy-coupling factor ABC transporter ATP-binding protein [Bacillus timonensis]|nr:energy-coupling factor ABC transporter ATP-binding protein [Bacillus timonensis]
MRELLQVSNLSFKYSEDANDALKNVSFSVYEGEWLAIVGHNGSGKSTLAKIMNGLLLPTTGKVLIDGITLSEETIWDIRSRLGMVFQNPDNQFVGTIVEDDVAFGLENFGVTREEIVSRVAEAIGHVRMEDFLKHEPHSLSGGQKQRVAIAGVLAISPQIIILDEATSMLDPQGREEVIETVRQLRTEKGITVISITHDLTEAARADRVLVMKHGQVYMEGTPEEIFMLEKEMEDIGLDIPFAAKVCNELINQGFPLSKRYVHEEGLVNEIWTLLQKD